jgi:hypothetical protein
LADLLQSPGNAASRASSTSTAHHRTSSRSHGHARGPSFGSILKKHRRPPKASSETFWPSSLDQECEKAGRVLRGFCRDGSVVVTSGGERESGEGKMVVPSQVGWKTLLSFRPSGATRTGPC